MIAACLASIPVHALLHHDPFRIIGDNETMQVKIESILHGGTIYLGHQAARLGQLRAIKPFADRDELLRSASRVLTAAAANMESRAPTQLAQGRVSSLQSHWW